MSILTQLTPLVIIILISMVYGEDICSKCECLPSSRPTQAICRNDEQHDQEFSPSTNVDSLSLELIYIYGIKSISFKSNSIITMSPVTLLIQNCSIVNILEHSIGQPRTLLVRDADYVQMEAQPTEELWAVGLEDIKELKVDSVSLTANYSVSIKNIESLLLKSVNENKSCSGNPDFAFSLIDSQVKPVPKTGLTLCGGNIIIKGNSFESVAEEGFVITTDGSIIIEDNKFEYLTKQAFNLSSPEIRIVNNEFKNFPAGVLRGVFSLQESFFSNNTITDIDLGGVLLDMSWEMVVEHNIIECDCASKRTSILNPKQDMLFLTNNSYEKLQNIFDYNYCNLNCTVSLKKFSYALIQGSVCLTNRTKLEEELLCDIIIEANIETTLGPTASNNNSFVFSTASRIEAWIPYTIVILTLIITSSFYYGYKELNTFRFTFRPQGLNHQSKISLQ